MRSFFFAKEYLTNLISSIFSENYRELCFSEIYNTLYRICLCGSEILRIIIWEEIKNQIDNSVNEKRVRKSLDVISQYMMYLESYIKLNKSFKDLGLNYLNRRKCMKNDKFKFKFCDIVIKNER